MTVMFCTKLAWLRDKPDGDPLDNHAIVAINTQLDDVVDQANGWLKVQTTTIDGQRRSGFIPIDCASANTGPSTPQNPIPHNGSQPAGNAADLNTLLGREAFIYNYWIKKGFTDFQAAAAVGNFKGETGDLNPSILGGFHGLAFGLAQWLGLRKQGVLAFGNAKGIDLTDNNADIEDRIVVELDYVWKEFHTLPGEDTTTSPEHPSFMKIVQSTSLEEAANGFAAFERWEGWQHGRAGDLPNHLHYKYADEALISAHNGVYSNALAGHNIQTKINVAFGDSLALGVNDKIEAAHVQITGDTATALGDTIAKVGIGPIAIEQNIANFLANANAANFVNDQLVCLSGGASNVGNLGEIDSLTTQIRLLVNAGANLVVLGVAKNGVFPSQQTGTAINNAISRICNDENVRFTGGFVGSGAGNIHPANYSSVVSLVLGAANA